VCHSGAVAPVTGLADLAIDRIPQALAYAVRSTAEAALRAASVSRGFLFLEPVFRERAPGAVAPGAPGLERRSSPGAAVCTCPPEPSQAWLRKKMKRPNRPPRGPCDVMAEGRRRRRKTRSRKMIERQRPTARF
jgi:hypothetical protein